MKLLMIAALAVSALAACQSSQVEQNAEKSLIAARAAHESVCSTVLTAHSAGILIGDAFNQAKAACIKADSSLDVADRLYQAGKTVEALSQARDALDQLDQADSLTTASKEQKP